MASSAQQQTDVVNSLKAAVKSLTVHQLKDVLRQKRLTVSGCKTVLQSRLISQIDEAHRTGNTSQLESIQSSLGGTQPKKSTTNFTSNSHSSSCSTQTPRGSLSPQVHTTKVKMPGHESTLDNPPAKDVDGGKENVSFPDSPFYKILGPLTDTVECKERETTRDTAHLTVNLSPEVADQIQRDNNIRVMVFCADENHAISYRPSDISFPHQVELKCNDQEVKANLRGVKNKPGSARPADITSLLNKTIPNHPNVVEMVYALTTKKFYVLVNLVIKKPVEDLVSELRCGKYLSKERVLNEIKSKASDPDIVATSSVMSLKCPLSFTRIKTPCRGTYCSHNQCFDATSYLQLQEQAPTWTCPVCNKAAAWKDLVLDYYFNDILKNTPKAIEQVTIEPRGAWRMQSQQILTPSGMAKQQSPPPNPIPSGYNGDDDFIENKDAAPMKPREFPQTFTPALSSICTPPIHPQPTHSNPTPSTSRKRPHSEVIDLTLSDDEPVPPTKRFSISSSNGGRYPATLSEFSSQPLQFSSNQRNTGGIGVQADLIAEEERVK